MSSKTAFKYRAYPTPVQKRYINDSIRACWWFYRFVLHHYEEDYRGAKKNFNDKVLVWYNQNAAYHPNWCKIIIGKPKIPKEFYPNGAPIRFQGKGNLSTYKLLPKARSRRPYLNDIPAVVLQEVLERVAHAFDKFWRDGAGYPNYPKERDYSSVTWTGVDNIALHGNEGLVKLSKFPGLLKIKYHRPMQGIVKRANISKDILGQYYISLMCEFDDPKARVIDRPAIGIDMNIKAIDESSRSFITCSNGDEIDIPRWYSDHEEKVSKLQLKLSKEKKDPLKAYRVIKHIKEKAANRRNNWLHNLTREITDEYGYVCIEDIDLKQFHKKRDDPSTATNIELAGDRGQRKAWTETPFGEFKRQLKYKLGNRLVLVNPAYTSKRCSNCGTINQDLTLDQREWKCDGCGTTHDRDTNAAINILNSGMQQVREKSENMGTET